jgi:hypothetical protein
MTLREPENTDVDRPTLDSGVHVRDSERAPASSWQILMVTILVVAILCVFFYGLTSQRVEVAGSTPPPATQTNLTSTEQQKTKVGTTGQAPAPANPQGATRQQQPQKTDATPTNGRGGQNEVQPPTAPQKNQ